MEFVEISACYMDDCKYNNYCFCDHPKTCITDAGEFIIPLDDDGKCKNYKMAGGAEDDQT